MSGHPLHALTYAEIRGMISDLAADADALRSEADALDALRKDAEAALATFPPLRVDSPHYRSVPVEMIRDYLRDAGEATVAGIAAHFHISEGQARAKVRALAETGTVVIVVSDVGADSYRLDRPDPGPLRSTGSAGSGPRIASGVPRTGSNHPKAVRRRMKGGGGSLRDRKRQRG